jgi:hypothetical protein
LPSISSLIFLVGIYLNVYPWPAAPMTFFPLIVLGVIIGAVLWGTVLQKKGSPLLHRLGHVLFVQDEAATLAEDAQ